MEKIPKRMMSILKRAFEKLKSFFRSIFGIKKKPFLPENIKNRAERNFKLRIKRFKQIHHRDPDRDEIFVLVVRASHDTIRLRNKRGHWIRQKIRKHLVMKYKIRKNYVMR